MSAANQQQYALLFTVGNGKLLSEMQDISFNATATSQDVLTLAKGLAGQSQGAPMVSWNVKNAMPIGGFEWDVLPNMIALIPVTLQLWGPNGKKSKGQAWIKSVTIEQGVGKQASYDFTAVGPVSLFS